MANARSDPARGCAAAVMTLAQAAALTLLALRADGMIDWPWYWLLAPLPAAALLNCVGALFAAAARSD